MNHKKDSEMKKVLFLVILGVLTACSSPVSQPKEKLSSSKPVESVKPIDNKVISSKENLLHSCILYPKLLILVKDINLY